jgi:hypothetical protein
VASEPAQASQPGAVRHRRIRLRLSLAILLVFGVVIVLGWRFSKPSSANIPADLPEKQEIARVLHHFTIRHGFRALRGGNVREFVRVMRIARKQRVGLFRANQNGTFRVYTVVDNPKEKDGWFVWWRHEMEKTNDHWVITRSY